MYSNSLLSQSNLLVAMALIVPSLLETSFVYQSRFLHLGLLSFNLISSDYQLCQLSAWYKFTLNTYFNLCQLSDNFILKENFKVWKRFYRQLLLRRNTVYAHAWRLYLILDGTESLLSTSTEQKQAVSAAKILSLFWSLHASSVKIDIDFVICLQDCNNLN